MNPQEARERAEQEAEYERLEEERVAWDDRAWREAKEAEHREWCRSFGLSWPPRLFAGDERWEIRERYMADQEDSRRTNEYHEQLFR